VQIKPSISMEEAAAVPYAGLTVFSSLNLITIIEFNNSKICIYAYI